MDVTNGIQVNRPESVNTNSTLIKNIYDFLQTGDRQIKYSPNKDIVLLLGNTGSGKSTLTYYISGNSHLLWSQEVGEDTSQYIIVDKQKKISSNSTILSQTIFPELVENEKTNTLYYDCPGFSDTRSAAHEIAATYFIKKVIDRARSVKLVFVVSHNSVTSGENRKDFLLLLKHATDFIKRIEKFKNSIALVVTKIENRYAGGKLVPDKKVINAIGKFLEQAKRDIDGVMATSHDKTNNTKEKVLSLLDIFQTKGENEQYTRIGIFRKPDAPGLISDIDLMKEGKVSLENLVNNNIQFVEADDNDFGYTISDESKIHLSNLAEEINRTIITELLNLGKEVEEYCIAQEGKTSDLEYLNDIFQKLEESFSKIQADAIADSITPEMLISEIAKAKRDIDGVMATSHGKSNNTKEKVLSLLDIFQSKGEIEQYTRIGIFRKPDAPGLISDIDLMKEGKVSLENLVNNNIQFVEADDNDFGYTISDESKIHSRPSNLAKDINRTIVTKLFILGKEVEEYCIAQEEKTSDLECLNDIFQKLEESFSKIQADATGDFVTPEILISEIVKNIEYFKINKIDKILDVHTKTIEREGDYIKFLNLVSNQSIKSYKSSVFAAGLLKLTEYLKDTRSFYGVLNTMYQRLSQYDIQKNKNMYNSIHMKELNSFFESPIFKKIEIDVKQFKDIRKMNLSKPKLALFNRVLEQTLTYQIEMTRAEIDKVIVKGMNVKLSDLNELWDDKDLKFVEIYALHKVFIDTSLDLTGREIQMAIIAPVWEVIGSASIILDGKPGMGHYPQQARSGMGYGISGEDGLPGEPGGPAGNFLGIGENYINEENLHISANGGNGGRGQDGGHGSAGYDGANCPNNECIANEDLLITIFYNKGDAEYSGGKGGNGGNGGIGGYGGHKGNILLYKVGKESGAVQAKQNANDGHLGENGKGGNGGRGGRYFRFKVRNYALFVNQETFEPMDKWGRDGISGHNSGNIQIRKSTWRLTKLLNSSNAKREFANYLLSNMNTNLQEISLKRFLGEMDKSYSTVKQPTNRKKRHVMNFRRIPKPKEQLRNMNKHDPIVIQSQRYDRYVEKGRNNNYLDLYHNFSNSTGVNKSVFKNFYLEMESIKQTPSMPIFPNPRLSENIKTEKYLNNNNGYTSMDLHGNLLLSEMILKKFLGKDTLSDHDHEGRTEGGSSYAHELAYKYYRKQLT